MVSLKESIQELAKKINTDVKFPSGWDSKLPEYACIQIEPNARLVIARSDGDQYVVSLVNNGSLTSILIPNIHDGIEAKAFITKPNNSNNATKSTESSEATQLKGTNESNTQLNRGYKDSRDPNAPPGFEDELQMNSAPQTSPSLIFNPDADRLPPGGRYPTLDPMGAGNLRLGPGGMSPFPQSGFPGSAHIRYDPTSPFDRGNHSPTSNEGLGGRGFGYTGPGGFNSPGFGFPPI